MFTKSAADITFSDVEGFCREFGEGVRVEYKQEINKDIPKIVSSFANTLGGVFLIGVKCDKKTNKVVSIDGIPNSGGIEEQIHQSALTGIYPAIIPEVKICHVRDSDNVVVIVRVDESVQAPHAIEKSTKVYIRVASITQPYNKLKLAEIDRIEYMLKRREDSQATTRQIIKRTNERIESLFDTTEPNLTVIAHPMFPYRPVISTGDIFEFARQNQLQWRYSSRVAGGFYASTDRRYDSYSYCELNEYGIVYHSRALTKVTLPYINHEEKYLHSQEFVSTIGESIKRASSFYEKCEYFGNIEITAQLRHVFDEKLRFSEHQHPSEMGQSIDSEVLASTQCLPRDLVEREKFIDVVDELAGQLLWSFDIDDSKATRELVGRFFRGM